MEEKKLDGLEVFDWFRTHVIDTKLEPNISHDELVSEYVAVDWFHILL